MTESYAPRGTAIPALDQPYPGAPMGEVWRRFWKKGFTFSGRASRSEYWKFALVQLGVTLGLYLVLVAVLVAMEGSDAAAVVAVVLGILMMVWLLATLIPSIALAVRRLHDANYPGAYYLFSFVPFGSIVILVLLAQASNPAGARFDVSAAQAPYGYNPTPGWSVPPGPQPNSPEPFGYRPDAGFGQPPAAYGQPPTPYGQPPAPYGQPPPTRSPRPTPSRQHRTPNRDPTRSPRPPPRRPASTDIPNRMTSRRSARRRRTTTADSWSHPADPARSATSGNSSSISRSN